MLTVRGLSKSFGSVQALQDVSATFAPGEIHAVLGENGAGKSTLMHLVAGFGVPDAGAIELDGQALPLGTPAQSKRLGIAMIHQHFTLVPNFTVEENLSLAALQHLGAYAPTQITYDAVEQAERLGWELDVRARTGDLPVGVQQRVEILKAISGEARAVIFDEPTAVLSPDEVEDLFRVLRELKREGKIVILIAHKLKEIMDVADRVTVLRRGKVVAESEIDVVTPTMLAEWMVGELPPKLQSESTRDLAEGLRIRELSVRGDRGEKAVAGIELVALRGEILGIGGVDGNGQVELAEAIAGVRPWSGLMHWEGGNILSRNWPRIAYIPQDRQTDGLALSMTIEDNLMIEGHRREALTTGPFLKRGAGRKWASELANRFSIKADSIDSKAGELSGGNQQKVVVARALDERPDLLVAVNPTRGLDVKATEYVHRKILEARDQGAAVVLISTDLDELAAIASRTVFLSRGKIVEGAGAAALLGGAE